MWENQVAPRLREIVDDEVTVTRNIKTLGMSEAAIDEIMSEFFGQENPYLGIYSKADGIHLRVIARAANEGEARTMIQPVETAIGDRLGEYIWGYDDETPEQSVGQALLGSGLTLGTMEYCTGGFLANSITNFPQSAEYFRGGIVAFTAEQAVSNGVPAAVLEQHGLVSEEAAKAMAPRRSGQAGRRLRRCHHRRSRPGRAERPPGGPDIHRHSRARRGEKPGDAGAAPPHRHQTPRLQHRANGATENDRDGVGVIGGGRER